jgi:tetratricopeptide (TPR) repeat protein
MSTARRSNADLVSELRALGTLCHSQGDHPRAEQHFRLALSLYETTHPEEHVDAAICLFGLIQVLKETGRNKEAQQFESQLEEMNERRRAATAQAPTLR